MINLFTFFKRNKSHVVIDDSGASSVSILETILSPEGKKELQRIAEYAKKHKLQQP